MSRKNASEPLLKKDKSKIIDNHSIEPPKAQGLYNPINEKDSCGVGFVVDLNGKKSRRIIDLGLESVCSLEHRGSVGADPYTGDGSGLCIQIPDSFFKRVCSEMKDGFDLPVEGRYAIAFIYMPQDEVTRKGLETLIEKVTVDEGQTFLGWRNVPINTEILGELARKTLPVMRQCFIEASTDITNREMFERKLYLIRRIIDRRVRLEYKLNRSQYYVASFSCNTIIYKGMLTSKQLTAFYPDLNARDMESALALFHERYSTNTFPTWDLAQPFRMIAHNGEINTVKGNKNWMEARQMVMESHLYGKNLKRMLPIIMEGQSDSATFDTVAELLVRTGRSLPHAMMMMIPEAWSKNQSMPADLKGFYEYHATMLEPWDGPAAMVFTDGVVVGATLDRNGLRPGRYLITKDNLVIMASEVGTVSIEPEMIKESARLKPGQIFLIDTEAGRLIQNDEIKTQIARAKPYALWVKESMLRLSDLPEPDFVYPNDFNTLELRQRAFGYTKEDLYLIMAPMASSAQEAVGSMGIDSALAVLTEEPSSLFRYFKQQFAQVTNPPIDPLREGLVMELTTYIGPEGNLLSETQKHAHRLELEHPVLTNKNLEKIRNIKSGHFKTETISILFDAKENYGMRNRLEQIQEEAVEATHKGYNLIILSDRGIDKNKVPLPSLLALSAVHQKLIKAGLRTKIGLIVESGEPREVMHFALLLGYGANAINPYLAFESLIFLFQNKFLGELPSSINEKVLCKNFIQAIGKGLLKIFSKMGISTLQSYCGAQIFEAVGIDSELISLYFSGTSTSIEGLSLEMLEKECLLAHSKAFGNEAKIKIVKGLESGSLHHYRKYGISHLLNPKAIHLLQHSCRTNDYKLFKEFSEQIDNQEKNLVTLRGLFDFEYSKPPVPLEEVEPEEKIMRRFVGGAMSFGSISWEAHTDMAIAMNQIGAKSNTGEGGEDAIRYQTQADGTSMRSAIKQVASARFGVTAHYLVNADEIQIKIAQGAKPGEGGQLPGHKVDEHIARLRYSTPGVTLISPPPHHDIYSIEDIKQLIFDLKNVNPKARISVKLVSESGVGTVAAGVAKANADHIQISGYDGGTGASPVSSIHHTGTPWELGLSEAHQTLMIQGLRDRVCLSVDGKMLTGKDVIVAALLGAEEYGFAIAPLITLGCIMMRKCHLNTCPVGIATQDPQFRKHYLGKPEYIVNYMRFISREVREWMATLGFRTINEMIGQVGRIKVKTAREISKEHPKSRGLDFSKILYQPVANFGTKPYNIRSQKHNLDKQLDIEIIKLSTHLFQLNKDELKDTNLKSVHLQMKVGNHNRSVGSMLSGEIARHFGEEGLPEELIKIDMMGMAGQSFGAFLSKGVHLRLEGQANDYVGKGLSGGKISIRIPKTSTFQAEHNTIAGNTCLYGATSGEAYFNGQAGERFAVRNSGAIAVVEGIGDHGCEYMTGGRIVILGVVGRNFAAGMSGGIVYIYQNQKNISEFINAEMIEYEPLVMTGNSNLLKTDNKFFENECKKLIISHWQETNSKLANMIITNWEVEATKFIKLIPTDYKNALLLSKKNVS